MEATGENTKSGAIDKAVIHYLEDIKNKGEVVDELSADHVEALSTAALPLERDVEHTVGPPDQE